MRYFSTLERSQIQGHIHAQPSTCRAFFSLVGLSICISCMLLSWLLTVHAVGNQTNGQWSYTRNYRDSGYNYTSIVFVVRFHCEHRAALCIL